MIGRFDASRVIRIGDSCCSLARVLLFQRWPSVSSDSSSISLILRRSASTDQLQSQPWPLARTHRMHSFVPTSGGPVSEDNPNTRRSLGTCPDGYAALLKPVVAWPGDIVTTSPAGVVVDGTPVPNSSPLTRDSLGRELHPYPYGTYEVLAGPDLGCEFLQLQGVSIRAISVQCHCKPSESGFAH